MIFNRILIPCDFLEVSYNALQHGAFVASLTNSNILLLHLMNNADKRAEAEQSMSNWKQRLEGHFQGKIETFVEEGDIMRDIGSFSSREKCDLVIMPTHGMKGMQEFTGSMALNIITEAGAPFIVVQGKPVRQKGYERIVIPVDSREEILDASNLFLEIAQMFNSEVFFVINTRDEDNGFRKIQKDLEEKFGAAGIKTQSHDSIKFDFSKDVAEYAGSVNADLICSVNFAYENLYSLYPRTDEEDLIYNTSQIPVLLVTPDSRDNDLDRPLED